MRLLVPLDAERIEVDITNGVLPEAATLDELATSRGTQDTIFTVSGYRLTYRTQEHDILPGTSFRERLMAEATPVNLNSMLNAGFVLHTNGNGEGRGGTFSGDSGGPVFLGTPNPT